MRSLYALYLFLSVAIPAIQPRLRLSGINRLRSAFHGGQRWKGKKQLNWRCTKFLGHVILRLLACGL
ncbi:MAG: hypothetical protein KZQ63_04590 [Candidatus Thiodiazotropha sp. (ex Lucinoma aequizonata)]|nr:hypothetical protein [Candidatus Thiodiazotropha sp. (ex Lucinoma aequizonata)]